MPGLHNHNPVAWIRANGSLTANSVMTSCYDKNNYRQRLKVCKKLVRYFWRKASCKTNSVLCVVAQFHELKPAQCEPNRLLGVYFCGVIEFDLCIRGLD